MRSSLVLLIVLSLFGSMTSMPALAQSSSALPQEKSGVPTTDEWKSLENKGDEQSAIRWEELKEKGLIPSPEQSSYKGEMKLPGELNPISGLNDPTPSLKTPRDGSFTVVPFVGASSPDYRNDDRSSQLIHLPFAFNLYGSSYNAVHINNNGNISFDQPYYTFSSTGFPVNRYPMVAPFWADIDTRNPASGLVYYKVEAHRLTVIWELVGYYNQQAGKKNTFEVIISDGSDTLVGLGNNVCFSYGDMQWTTGNASGGVGGFGGVPATAGVNKGDGVKFAQIGRFNQNSDVYDGPGGNPDGVNYLDGKQVCFNASGDNISPIAVGFPAGNIIEVTAGTTLTDTVYFLSPELGQTTQTLVDPSGLANFTYTSTDGNVSSVQFTFSPTNAQVGDNVVQFTATDNGSPVGTTTVSLILRVKRIATISGMKFNDLDGDGIKDQDESGIAGWRILLNGGLLSVTTDATGRYQFAGITPGTYTVSEEQKQGWIQTYPSSSLYTIQVNYNDDYTGNDFGNYQYSTISGVKFHDLNSNGVRDINEPGLAGWLIEAIGPTTDSVITDENGVYQFLNLIPGTYVINEVQRPGWQQTFPASEKYFIAVTSGSNTPNIDFGNIQLGIITGTKFEDINGNGVREEDEPGLAGWTIHLVGPTTRDTVTDEKGNYSFSYLLPGSYVISEEQQIGWTQKLPQAPGVYNLQIDLGTVHNNIDFGNFKDVTITAVKYDDTDGDGTLDMGEPPIEGWSMTLNNGQQQLTGPDGRTSWTVNTAGTYTVAEEIRSGWTSKSATSVDVTVQSGSTPAAVEFLNFKNINISGLKFNDMNGNGIQDIGDNGLSGWTMFLDANGNGTFDGGEASAITDGTGNYTLANVSSGTHRVREVSQTGWTQTTTSPSDIAAVSGQNVSNVNFGNFRNISISGQKYNDMNGNGVKDLGDNGLSGWNIFLDANGNGTLDGGESNTTSDGSGNYNFTNLLPGTYKVREVQQNGWTKTTSDPSDIVAVSGQDVSGVDFGNFDNISISGQKFNDVNGNGLKDIGENGLSGWTLFLDANSNGTLDGGEVNTTSDGSGNYNFNNLSPGTYRVREVQQNGWTKTTSDPSDITAVSGQDVSNIDFGNFQNVSISGQKYNDMNGNGTKDAGDAGLSGWTIFLDANGNGTLDGGEASTVTDGIGNYSFTNLMPGTYKVREVVQNGWVRTSTNPTDIVATSGGTFTNVDFGNYRLVSISGKKYNDMNGNGVLDAGDAGLPNWTIFLDANGNGTLDGGETNVQTDANGDYSFQNIMAGTYKVREVQQAGWVQTTSNPADFTAMSGNNATDVNFGNFQRISISGQKYEDLNGNGTKDGGENGLQNWTIFFDANDNGTLDGGETNLTTDVNGNYTFTNVSPGTYKVREVVQSGWMRTSSNPSDISAVSGSNVSGINFGNFKLFTISGQKYNDMNGNGVKDAGDNGLQNWTIFFDNNNNGTLDGGERNLTTDGSGNYTFTDVGPGTYKVREVLQNGWMQTTTNPSDIVAVSGVNVSSINFGNFQYATISGMKYNDYNGNGVKDVNEPGLQGWTIKVTGAKNDSAVTNVSGNYNITGLIAGTYTVTEVLQSGWIQTTTNPAPVTLVSGQTVSNVNFGNFKNPVISGMKFNDANGNGIKEAGEGGLADWVIKASKGATVKRATTAGDGTYSFVFTQAEVGTWVVSESLIVGWQQTFPATGTYTILAQSAVEATNTNFGNLKLGSITGKMYTDVNGDSAVTSDPTLNGWTVKLFRNGQQVGRQVTSGSGDYSFVNLTAGTYIVQESLHVGWLQTVPRLVNAVAPVTNTNAGPRAYSVVIASGVDATGKDFANFQYGSISGTKWHDQNGDSLMGVSEPKLANWLIRLKKGTTLINTATTNASGVYTFSNVTAGTYEVSESLLTGWTQTFPASGKYTITVVSGTVETGKNFGNLKLGSISGTKFFDSDSSGTKNGCEGMLANFRFELSKGSVKETLTTGTNGVFSFINKLPGTYTLREIPKTGWRQTKPAGGASYTVTIASGVDTSGFEFGNFYALDSAKMRTMIHKDFAAITSIATNAQGYIKVTASNIDQLGANVKDTVFLRRGFNLHQPLDSGYLRMGIVRHDSDLFYGWWRYDKLPPRQPYFNAEVKTYIYNAWTYNPVNRPIDYVNFVGEKNTATEYANYGNQFSQELTVLKTNVGASDLGIFQSGLGDLIYATCSGKMPNGSDSVLVGLTVRQIIDKADSALTMGRMIRGVGDTVYRWPRTYLYMLDSVVKWINYEFYSATIETISTKPLRIKGSKALYKSSLLRRDPNAATVLRRFVIPEYAEYYKPTEFKLGQNYPNPFNPTTSIEFDLMEPARITLKIYNIVGQEVATLFNEQEMEYGRQVVQFNADQLASGVYFYKLEATATDEAGNRNTFNSIKKMMLMK
jgi:protocatechuate 3,4-dioxygenase beta subunit